MRHRAVLLLSCALALLLAACSGGGKGDGLSTTAGAAGGKKAAQPAVPVTVGIVGTRTVPVQLEAVGKVEPLATVSVLARVGGELTGVRFAEGQEVQKGQVLFTIDPRPYQAALDQAQAAVARDKAVAANSAADLKRYGDLVQKEYVTREQYDRIAADTASSGATVKADEAAVEAARLQLEYCTIRSPLGGRTGSLLVHAGNLVKANDAQPLVVIHQIQPIYVSFAVPEAELASIERYRSQGSGSQGQLTVESVPAEGRGASQQGALSFIDNQIDRTTGTILLKATFPNASRTLWPGQFTNVRLTLARQANAVVVPAQAVLTGQQGQYVYVVRADQTVENRGIQVARTVGGEAVIASGLSPGETVVTDGQLRLAPGTRIQAKRGAA
jgi:multidrug efflux system membrane fusion protein